METLIKTAAARAAGLTKIYGAGEAAVRALDRVTAEFPRERFTAIMCPRRPAVAGAAGPPGKVWSRG